MITAGIIAEYNPFHKGHEYHLSQARRLCGADYCIAAVSGSFVQRGEPGIIDKYNRAKMALLSGADLVVELPAAFSCAAAPDFAWGGMQLLSALGADYLCFGSESADLIRLSQTADALLSESPVVSEKIRALQKAGLSYAASLTEVIASLAHSTEYEGLIGSNDLLALEYLKAVRKSGSAMIPVPVRRVGEAYSHTIPAGGVLPVKDTLPPLSSEKSFASAGSLRQVLLSGEYTNLREQVPEAALGVLMAVLARYQPVRPDDFSDFIWYALQDTDPAKIAGCSSELAGRIKNRADKPHLFSDFVDELSGRNVSASTVRRALLHIALRYRKEEEELFRNGCTALYARILGFRKDSLPLLHSLKEKAEIPLVAKAADAAALLSPNAMKLFSLECRAAALYRQAVYRRSGYVLPDEYRAGVVIV